MIQTLTDLSALRALVNGWKREGLRVALVPTMGNLHAGHYSLVMLARQYVDRVVSSVFVNPTQFGPNEDFARYPRTPEADLRGLEDAGCDALWLPDVDTMYPLGTALATPIHAPGVSDVLEGECRPGHFDGVCTVVARLFNQVQPDVAAFGKKDYQQLAVIRQMVADLAFPIEILGGSIVREADGLAMSSRNQYLSAEDRPISSTIRKVLLQMRDSYAAGTPRAQVEDAASHTLEQAGFRVDYAVVRLPDLSEPGDSHAGARVALIAARLGNTRLIDNLEF
ncbi:pantoate--beta-alanine ligase [Xanthomonas citri pv. glycines]|uniref:Pantothenate synthetase n=1 Tax=Xanthomonas campestris pv. glycines TaxID=473421 RepID=A0AAX0I512_XANCG|nr:MULTISPECIES: pantoate--beta-alanine ligase [Xanthomonas]AOY63339.1 pantoate--beta-alanine ligase [Xanthomonas citri pv. glycines str. 8ra]ARV22840.1 pantoate--beta-alanine ligase [Xanthomonas citri pv. glycines str. 12-2]EWC53041.1 pantoate--beta-alanine ligase [Xanthomonas citri pv. glycines str. 8ra]OEY98711.1 pantoate--beta-alanine ligase [Xanthomonas citri pv. glycines]OOX01430.1 pantoate--beta-alanine ligase [Xanthomonas citri pv. glycines]